jgi:carbon monoxide dehydrogenase subunit G
MKLSFSLTASPDHVFRYLSEPALFTTVHPVIQKMEPLGDHMFKVFERIKLGFIPYSFHYVAQITDNMEKKTIRMEATIRKSSRIIFDFSIRPGQNGTIVEEDIQVEGMGWLKSLLEQFIRHQHNILFSNIDQK